MLENYLRRRLDLPDLSEEMDDESLDNQLQVIAGLVNGNFYCSLVTQTYQLLNNRHLFRRNSGGSQNEQRTCQ